MRTHAHIRYESIICFAVLFLFLTIFTFNNHCFNAKKKYGRNGFIKRDKFEKVSYVLIINNLFMSFECQDTSIRRTDLVNR